MARAAIGFIFVIGLVLLVVTATEKSRETSTARTASSKNAVPPTSNTPPQSLERTDVPPAKPRPSPGVYTNDTGRLAEAPFEILTSAGADYYIKLIDAVTKKDAIGIYVHGGQRLEVYVPLGAYEMRYASGETWRGVEHLFGPGDMTSYNKSNDIFDFKIEGEFVSGFTVELIRQAGGNMPTYGISADDF